MTYSFATTVVLIQLLPGLLYLHRRFFAMALRDVPDDPLKSPFAPSVLACYRSAVRFFSGASTIHYAMPAVTLRLWFFW
jgi:hypothetical protein